MKYFSPIYQYSKRACALSDFSHDRRPVLKIEGGTKKSCPASGIMFFEMTN